LWSVSDVTVSWYYLHSSVVDSGEASEWTGSAPGIMCHSGVGKWAKINTSQDTTKAMFVVNQVM
jgi:hypothetical protein